jgi:hypothetical protein
VPVATREFFDEAVVKAKWDEVVAAKEPVARVGFIQAVFPQLQAQINAKRLALVQPIDQLEKEVWLRLQAEYDQLRALNNAVTGLLKSAAKADANRKRLLELAGLSEQKISTALSQTSDSVALLLQTAQGAEGFAKQADAQVMSFKDNIGQIIDQLRK